MDYNRDTYSPPQKDEDRMLYDTIHRFAWPIDFDTLIWPLSIL